MSRLNSYRTLNKTLKVIQSMGGVELKGYTKVGENTFGNTVGFLAGYPLKQFEYQICDFKNEPQDDCPYLFKSFSNAGFLTAEIDDAPFGTSFNTGKVGFVRKPADFYTRPFMLAVMKHLKRDTSWYLRCLGRKQTEQVLLDYFLGILDKISGYGAPMFAHLWFTVLTHDCSLTVKYSDSIFASFLQLLTEKEENTIIFLMGDHGETYGRFRESEQGWYEDKLPFMWVYIPPRIRQRNPKWTESLQINSDRLSSHFDLYKTLVHILLTFVPEEKSSAIPPPSKVASQPGQSLFEPVPEDRSCESAGIPEAYCACAQPVSIPVNSEKALEASKVAFQYVKNRLPEEKCAIPTLEKVIQAKYARVKNGMDYFIVRFLTEPGHFMFEGTVKEVIEKTDGVEGKKSLVVENDVLRMSKMERKSDCVGDTLLQKYCYCK